MTFIIQRFDSYFHTQLSAYTTQLILDLLIVEYQPRFPTASTLLIMGKSDQKQTKKRGRKANAEERKHKNKPSSLDAMTFESTDNEGPRHSQWRDFFRQMCEFKVQFGHCLVPSRYAANPKLGQWVKKQRKNRKFYTDEKSSPMLEERIRALDVIGFDWGSSKADVTSIWKARLEQLREFKVQFGHCLVPQRYADNPKLGTWVRNQRINYKLQQEGKPSSMTAQRARELVDVGFDWNSTNASWNALLEQLAEYKVQFGRYLVPQRYPANPKLGKWVSNQRSDYRMYQGGKPSSMTAERIRVLESVGFDWAPVR